MTAPVVPLLTATQVRVLSFIRSHWSVNGFAPTLREIGDGCDLSLSSVAHQVRRLQEIGWIRKVPGVARALVVLDPATGGV